MSLRAGQGLLRSATCVCLVLSILIFLPPAQAASLAVVVTPGSTYLPGDQSAGTPTLVVMQGTDLTYTNLDAFAGHSVTSDQRFSDEFSTPIFDSGIVRFRSSAIVAGVTALQPGTYGFHCSIHEDNMRGSLRIVAR